MTENRPFALGGGGPREMEISRGPTAKKDNVITKTIILLIPERYHMPAIAVIIIYCFRGRHARFLLRGFQGW